MVARLLDQIVQTGALAAQDQNAIGLEVEVGVVGGPSLVQPKHPYVLFLHLLERADEVGDASDADMLGCARGGLGYGRGHRSGAPFGEDDPVDARAIGGPQQGSEIMRVFYAVEGEEELVLPILFGSE